MEDKQGVPIWKKYLLTVTEASMYFNIGETKLRRLLGENLTADYIIMNGTKILVKRKQFEEIIDSLSSI